MNKVILTGNFCRDMELSYTNAGKEYVNNLIAVSRGYKNADGEYESDFIPVVAWGATAVYLNKYAKKGDRAELVGRWLTDKYEDANGETRTANRCVIENIQVFSNKQKDQQKDEKPSIEDNQLPF